MNVKILEIALGARRFGKLFQYADLCRFVAEPEIVAAPPAEVLSLSMVANDAASQAALWSDVKNPLFNAQGGQLPRFFQNLLPEACCAATSRNCAAAARTTISSCSRPAAATCRAR